MDSTFRTQNLKSTFGRVPENPRRVSIRRTYKKAIWVLQVGLGFWVVGFRVWGFRS